MDASTLQLILMRYLDPSSEKAKDHLKAVEAELSGPGGLFYRYKHEDDFGKPKSSFLITAFWHVEALACVGRIDEAIEKFEQLLQYGNHLGLMSEDIDAADGSQWGNFPQAYSHVGLMNAAYRIAKKWTILIFMIPVLKGSSTSSPWLLLCPLCNRSRSRRTAAGFLRK
jgi:GH15 family glucan-1,4-alpha-glucosidase